MPRFISTVLYVLCAGLPAHCFPAPMTQEPETPIDVLLVGKWSAVTLWNKPPRQFVEYEFTIEGQVFIRSAGKEVLQEKRKLGSNRMFMLSENLTSFCACEVKKISSREMVLTFVGDETQRFVFRKK